MELQNLKTLQCPVCGCTTIIKESVDISTFNGREILKHTNGEMYEHRQFLCGMELKYSPNFHKEEVVKECTEDPIVIARIQKEKEDKEKVLQLLSEHNIDDKIVHKIKLYAL